ncbi:putative metallophosphoesterase [Magnetofaba australis IT-1]|uniref:Putative metallophosphoesterase n=1 Tax=Magnetofaba australis IT-1 TaxID=1434232 RepID=A0A1Y2K1R5_9PROT|nr:putative metallophosphoesterase [Magnetofaba australis IT-1]
MGLALALMGGEILYAADRFFGFLPDSPTLIMLLGGCIGVTFMLFVIAVIYDLLRAVGSKGTTHFDPARRQSLRILFDAAFLLMAISYLWKGVHHGGKTPAIRRVTVPIPGLKTDKFTIVQWSDVHVGRTIKAPFVGDLVERTNALKPDLVAITGDLADLPANRAAADLAPIGQLQAPVCYVPGNHEYFHGVEDILAYLEMLGVKTLPNASLPIGGADPFLTVVGLNDLMGNRWGVRPPDWNQAFAGVDQSKPVVVLAHQPKCIEQTDHHRCDLMLSGHTHGGQIFPFGLLVMLAQPYLAGLHTHSNGQQIYVSRGTGYWGPPVRVLAPSEITLLTLVPA